VTTAPDLGLPTATVTHVCCGQRLSHVSLSGLGAELSFTHCARCETTRWYRGNTPVDPAQPVSLPEVPPSRVSHRQG
jgi:hypothetical protein